MVRQGLCRIAILLILALTTEILIGSVGAVDSRQKNQTKWRQQKRGQNQRIAGGELAPNNTFAYQVGIYYDGGFWCAGTYLGGRHVLSAASCFFSSKGALLDKSLFHIVLRSSKSLVIEDDSITRKVKKIVAHPNFDKKGKVKNNIAILTLTLPISQKIPQVKLEVVADFNRTDYSGQTAEAVGWGFTEPYLIDEDNPSRIISNQLNKVDLTIMSATECNEKFRLQFPNNVRDNTEGGTLICASGALKKGVCEYDDGGPLLVNGVQVGITNLPIGCGDNRIPMLFVRVAAFRKWINQNRFN